MAMHQTDMHNIDVEGISSSVQASICGLRPICEEIFVQKCILVQSRFTVSVRGC